MKNFAASFSAILVLLLSGCASVPMASLDLDTKAKDFSPVPNKASLYIYRNESFGAAIPMTVSVNGKVLGQTAAQTYLRISSKSFTRTTIVADNARMEGIPNQGNAITQAFS
ncbi:MAG: hypothetical protein ACYCZ6_03515 [Polaromonas sp.]